MIVYPLGEDRACFFLSPSECPTPESLTTDGAKSLMRQAFAQKSIAVELEAFWSGQGTLLFARQRAEDADFAALLRQEILTGRGILKMEVCAPESE